MISCTRLFRFDAGHRVLGHKGLCRHLHGHSYQVEVTVSVSELNALGMVIDFADLKEGVGNWINSHLDHNLLLNTDDPLLPHLIKAEERKPYLMPCNPTAENIAREIYLSATHLLPKDMTVTQVRVWETPNCYADYFPVPSKI